MAIKSQTPRLGRGLAALLGDAAPPMGATPDRSLRNLPIGSISPNPFQPRQDFDPSDLAQLSLSIQQSGILQPLLVRAAPGEADHWQLVSGERRWRAAQLAGLHEVPCLIRSLSDSEAAVAALIENLQRQDLNAIEEAQAYRKLIEDFGLTQEEVGQTVGRSRVHITNTLRLLSLPDEIQKEVVTGALSAGHARSLIGRDDAAAAARRIIDERLSVRQAEQLGKQGTTRPPKTAASSTDATALTTQLSAQLGLDVEIKAKARGAWLVLKCRDLEQLDRVIAQLRGSPA